MGDICWKGYVVKMDGRGEQVVVRGERGIVGGMCRSVRKWVRKSWEELVKGVKR